MSQPTTAGTPPTAAGAPAQAPPAVADGRPLRVAVVAEFYPRATDPVLGVWAHRQALAVRDAGAEVEVLVLHRPVPPRATPRRRLPAELWRLARQPRREVRDGISVTYVPFLSPVRGHSYPAWGRWAAPTLAVALRLLHRRFAYDVLHVHNAVPAGDATLRALGTRQAPWQQAPVVLSVHGGDVYYTAPRWAVGEQVVRRAFAAADLVVANSAGTARRCQQLGAPEQRSRVVRLGTDLPDEILRRKPATRGARPPRYLDPAQPQTPLGGDVGHHDWRGYGRAEVDDRRRRPTGSRRRRRAHGRPEPRRRPPGDGLRAPVVATVGHLVARKRHADVIRALWLLRTEHPRVRYRIIGDGPERRALAALAEELELEARVELVGQLEHHEAVREGRAADVFAMPSVDEAFGVAYVEAMAGAVPAIGCLGEAGPEEIAGVGEGMVLVPPAEPVALASALDQLLSDPGRRIDLGNAARRTVLGAFTWAACGPATVDVYREALAAGGRTGAGRGAAGQGGVAAARGVVDSWRGDGGGRGGASAGRTGAPEG